MTDPSMCSWPGCTKTLAARNTSGICRDCRNGPAQAGLKTEWRHGDLRRGLLTGARQRSRERGLPFDLEIDDIVIPELCPILGIPLTYGDGAPHAGSPSLDRINGPIGYVRGNVRVVSHKANACKNSLDDDQLFQFCLATLTERGFEVTQIVERIDCPRCYSEGPHERVACAVDGSTRSALCDRCHLEWKIAG